MSAFLAATRSGDVGALTRPLARDARVTIDGRGGALEQSDYERKLREAGFREVEIVPTRYYRAEDVNDPSLAAWLAEQTTAERERLSRAFMSAFVRAVKPAG